MRIDTNTPTAAPAETGAQLKDAANAFEAMMLQEILRSAVPGDSSDPRHGLALQAVAADLAPAINFGLARLLEKQA